MCNLCNGTKIVEKKANVVCKHCKGTTRYTYTCNSCDKDGMFTTKSGKKIVCKKCNGTKKITIKCNKCKDGMRKFHQLIICPKCGNKKPFNGVKINR